ncbi:MAG: hypothetical protein ABI548_09625 [Polyangiaceae bacterium]
MTTPAHPFTSASVSHEAAFEQRVARVETLLTELSHSSDPMLERATREVLSTVLELHRRGLERVLELAAREDAVRDALARDSKVSAMLLLHGLHPVSLGERVKRTIGVVRERFAGKLDSVEAEVLGAGSIVVRIVPAASTCGSTRQAVHQGFEEALLSAVPDADSVSVEFAEAAPMLIQLRLRKTSDPEQRFGGTR